MIDNVYQMIARAQAEYARCIDDDRLEEWPDHFHGQCIYKVTTAANHREGLEAGLIFANSRGMLADRVSALREALVTLQEDNEGKTFGMCQTCTWCQKLSQRIYRCGQMGDRLSGPETRKICRIYVAKTEEAA